MNHMFDNMGYNSTVFTLDLGDKFDTKNVTHMYDMFYNTGRNSTVFTLDLGDKFNTSNVIYISRMFEFTGYKSTVFKLDCSSWNVDNVTSHDDFNYAVQDKVTPPQWKK